MQVPRMKTADRSAKGKHLRGLPAGIGAYP